MNDNRNCERGHCAAGSPENEPKRPAPVGANPRERGQMLALVAWMMMAMLGVTAMTVDVGRVFISYHELQASTDAAALAGGEALGQPGSTVASSGTTGSSSLSTNEAVNTYSSTSADKNAYSNLTGVTTTVTPECLTTLKNSGIPCYGAGSYNAIQVTQTVNMPTTFAAIFGTATVPLTATSTAAMAGAATTPYNVAIIVDTTGSMGTADSNCAFSGNSNPTRLQCSLYGVRTLLGELFPCASQSATCSVSSAVATNPVDQVALFTFPNITTTTVSDDQKCPVGTPTTNKAYAFPSATLTASNSASATPPTGQFVQFTPTGGSAVTMTYEVSYLGSTNSTNGFLSDYRASDTASSLNTSSILTIAAGGASCDGITNPGGAGTFYAGVLYAAADALIAEQAHTPTAQPAIILVSDGDASSSQQQMAGGSGAPGTDTAPTGTTPLNATSGGTYPSWVNECHQAITAAQNIAAGGFDSSGNWNSAPSSTYSKSIRIYAVAYGAQSTGCSTDTGTKAITPCTTMGDIASSPAYFYSDYKQGGSGQSNDTSCTGTGGSGQSLTNISDIFSAIFTTFTVPRLIPNSTT